MSSQRQVLALEFLFVDKSVNVPKIQDKPLFAGALGLNRKRVNNIWNAKNFFDEVETKKLINSYGRKRTVEPCGSIVGFVESVGSWKRGIL